MMGFNKQDAIIDAYLSCNKNVEATIAILLGI